MDLFNIITLLIIKTFPNTNFVSSFSNLIDKRDKQCANIIAILNDYDNISLEVIPKLIEFDKDLGNKVMELFLFKKISFYNKDFIMDEFLKLKKFVKDSSLEDFISLYKDIEGYFQEGKDDEDVDLDLAPSVMLLDTFKEWQDHDLIGLGSFAVMGAETGWGKTTLTTNLILDILKNNNDIKILYFGSMEIDKKEMRMKLGNILLGENLFALQKQIGIIEKEINMLKDKYELVRNKSPEEITEDDISSMIKNMIKGSLSLQDTIYNLKEYQNSLKKDITKIKEEISELEKNYSNNKAFANKKKEKLMFTLWEKQTLVDKTEEQLEGIKETLTKFAAVQNADTLEEKVSLFNETFSDILVEISEKEKRLKMLKQSFKEKDNLLKNHIYMKRIKIIISNEKIEIETVEREIKKELNNWQKIFVFIDYLQLLASKKDSWTLQESQKIALKLLDYTKKYKNDIGFFVLSQFNEKKAKGEIMTQNDIYGYTIVWQNLDSFLSLINLEKKIKAKDRDSNKTPITKLVSTKNRKTWLWEEYYFKFVRWIGKLVPIESIYKHILKENPEMAYYEDLMASGGSALSALSSDANSWSYGWNAVIGKEKEAKETQDMNQQLLTEVL